MHATPRRAERKVNPATGGTETVEKKEDERGEKGSTRLTEERCRDGADGHAPPAARKWSSIKPRLVVG